MPDVRNSTTTYPVPDGNGPHDGAVGYTAFADSALWQRQREFYNRHGVGAWAQGLVPHYAASHPAMAKAYARIALGFWRDLKAAGRPVGQPLYIIELGAGSGRFAYHFLLQFFEAFDLIRDPDDKVCYVMTDFAAATVSQWQHRPDDKLRSFVAQGRLDFAVFDAEADNGLTLEHQQIHLAPGTLMSPPVVIANYVFSALRQDLFFLEKDRLYEGWASLQSASRGSAEQPFAELEPTYRKRRILAPDYPDVRWNEYIQHCAAVGPPRALLFPAHALGALERLSHLHPDNFLLLSADRGTQPGDSAAPHVPDLAWHGSFSLPVDYQCLAHLVETQGGACWRAPASDGLAMLAACWRAPGPDISATRSIGGWRETALAAQEALQQYNPNDFYRVKQSLATNAQDLSPEQMLAFLRLSQWDTKVFYLMYPYLYDTLSELDGWAQQQWFDELNDVWRYHLPICEDYDLAYDLAALAAELNRWPAAIDWLQHSLNRLDPAQHSAANLSHVYFNLGLAHWQLADSGAAETCLREALKLARSASLQDQDAIATQDVGAGGDEQEEEEEEEDQEDEDDAPGDDGLPPAAIERQLADLDHWRSRCRQLFGADIVRLVRTAPAAPGDALFASLLGPHQAQALYRLQRSPELCRLAGVECLQSVAHAREWLKHEQRQHKHVLAILHPALGMVGVAALECPPGSLAPGGSHGARFYYWIGPHYQHRGFGRQALVLLHRLAGIVGVRHLFSTVDQSNAASRRVLATLGYRQLPGVPVVERPGYSYYHCGPDLGEPALHDVLVTLLSELGSAAAPVPSGTGGVDATC